MLLEVEGGWERERERERGSALLTLLRLHPPTGCTDRVIVVCASNGVCESTHANMRQAPSAFAVTTSAQAGSVQPVPSEVDTT